MDRPQPPPEATLIRLARKAAGIKAPAAAEVAGISAARWSQVETGYESRLGRYKPVRARDSTLAHMAYAVGVTAERLEETGRPDAAEVLREILRSRSAEADSPPGGDGYRPPDGERGDSYTVDADGNRHYDSPPLQRIWDDPDLDRPLKLALIAHAEAIRQNRNGGQGQRSA